MNAASQALRRVSGPGGRFVVAVVTAAAVVVVGRAVDTDLATAAIERAASEPGRVGLAIGFFALAFVLRALAWRRVLPSLRPAHALSAIHLALGANHVLPLRMGEPFRVLSVTRRTDVPVDAATASTITLRAADMLSVVVIGLVLGPAVFVDLVGPVGWVMVGAVAVAARLGWGWLRSVAERRPDVVLPGPAALFLSAAAWPAESVVVWQAARWAGIDLPWAQAMVVTTVAVAAQIAAIAPGGFGTYEAASVGAYVALGYDPEPALVAALGAHGLKTAYSLGAGAVALVLPRPGFLGRFRLASRPGGRPGPADAAGEPGVADAAGGSAGSGGLEDPEVAGGGGRPGSILLFLPAYNEEASIDDCLRRVPAQVLGRAVDVLVIDDGSRDRTAQIAEAAGAEVISLDRNRGLGAAVRVGLAQGVARGCEAVAFCDADGEYRPEELARMVGPILDRRADYVAGSRFLGRIDHMRPHRRCGNLVLSALLSIVARRRITDGQTGYRAFSPRAAADAEVIHDYNYAQVLTLDLLAKGYRYCEVPITYHFRTAGRSFIRLGGYLRNVVPAVYRELNAG